MNRKKSILLLTFAAMLLALLLGATSALAQGAPPGGQRATPPHATGGPVITPPPGGWNPMRDSGTIQLSIEGQEAGPLELKANQGGYTGEFLISNLGSDALTVTRVAMRGDGEDVRLPPKFSVHFTDGGGTAATIPAHGSKKVTVIWVTDKEPRMKQAFGHVVVTSSDEAAGEVAMGVTAQLVQPLSFITNHLLSILTFMPLLGVLIASACTWRATTTTRCCAG